MKNGSNNPYDKSYIIYDIYDIYDISYMIYGPYYMSGNKPQHIVISIVGNCIYMGWHFSFSLILVTSNNMGVVYWQPLVRIYCDTKQT